jgi:two-component system, cell cycle sensor histidine kinase and response regulator CckA
VGGEDHLGERLGPEAFRSLAEQSPDGIAILRSGRYVFASPSWAECLGASVDELVRESFLDRVYPEDRVTIQQWLECPNDGSISEYRFSANGGRTRLLQLTRVRIPTGQGELLGLIGRDATHLKQTQAQLLLADRMMSIGALAAGTAHEINNPLTYVQGNLSFAVDDLRALSDEVGADRVQDLVEALEEAEEGAERVRVIVRRLHAFARADQDEMQVVDVNRVVEDAVNMAFTEYRHRARLTKELADNAFVRANGARLGQVLLNLLLNAAHALPEGEAEKNFIQVSTRVEDGQVFLAVRDSGPGIPPEIRGRVFDAFFTTKPVGIGTGLGLSIAHSVVTDLGGRIRVDSELGQGTTFEVVLPFSDPSAEADDEWGISGSVEAPARVLVIDDEPLIAGALRRALRDHTVEVAASGRDAIELLRTREYDLVFCDLMMPEVTGMDVYAWAERERPGLERTFVLMTGGIFTPRAKAFLHSVQGKNRSVEKPFDMEKLRRFVSTFLQARAASKTALSTGDI